MPTAKPKALLRRAASPRVVAPEPRTPSEIVDARVTNPRTGLSWPKWNYEDDARLYLERVHGLSSSKQTLAHHRSQGIGIKWRWHGQRPVTTLAELDRYVAEEALRERSPLASPKPDVKERASVPRASAAERRQQRRPERSER
jgi:hypothetical protein